MATSQGVSLELKARQRRPSIASDSLPRRLGDALERAGHDLAPKIQAAARQRLPRGGGLAGVVAAIEPAIDTDDSGNTAHLTITHPKGGIDRGTVVHPVFGTDVRVSQSVPPGFVSDTLKASTAEMRAELVRAAEAHARAL